MTEFIVIWESECRAQTNEEFLFHKKKKDKYFLHFWKDLNVLAVFSTEIAIARNELWFDYPFSSNDSMNGIFCRFLWFVQMYFAPIRQVW